MYQILYLVIIISQLSSQSPSIIPPCSEEGCVKLCCPSGSAFTSTEEYEDHGRCETEPRMERRCQPYQELPSWSTDWGQEEIFQCSNGGTLVPAEILYGPQEYYNISQEGTLSLYTDSYNYSDYCLVFTDIPDYYDYQEEEEMTGTTIRSLYSVCHVQEEERGRIFTGIFYPAAIFISDLFILITLCVYLYVRDLRKKIFGKITIGFLFNVFICYTFLGIHYSLDLFSHKELLDTVFCKVLGYIIQHSFLGFFFWMSAMAFNVAYTFSNSFTVKKSSSQMKSLFFNVCYAQGSALIITCVTIGMDFFGPCDYVLPNMGKFSCFLGSEFNPDSSFLTTSEFLYFYLVISIIMVSNLICFIITGASLISHWWQMKELQSSISNSGLKNHCGVVLKLFIIMGIPWIFDIISAVVSHAYGIGKSFEVRLTLDILNLLTGVLIFLVLVCKKKVVKSVKTQHLATGGTKPSLETRASNFSKSSVSSQSSVTSQISYGL